MIAAPAFVSTRYSLVGEPIALVKTWTGKEFGRVPGRQAGNDAGRKIGTAMTEDKPPFPPFTRETATQKVRAGEDGWNGRDPVKVASAYTVDSWWRNRSEFVEGRDAIIAFLTRKWQHELEYRLIKEMWAFEGNRIAVRFAYEYHDPDGAWFRAYGNENWHFDEHGLMRWRHASINDVPIKESERKFHWDRSGPRPLDHPGLSDFGF